jgi:predicted alpha/beta superfamily hydrolase
MLNRAFVFLSVTAVAGCALVTPLQADPPGPAASTGGVTTEVLIPNTRRIDFVSKVNGHRYSIRVALPFQPVPAKGYPVFYVLDGDFFFASATEIVRGSANVPQGAVVVGICYPDDPPWVQNVRARRGPFAAQFDDDLPARGAQDLERNYDLTLPVSDKDLAAQSLPGSHKSKSEDVGGVDEFLKTIETDVKPRVAALTHIDSANQVLFGDSHGGLAALHALFVEPNAFRTFVIGSPTIWWNNKAVLADEAKFAAAVSAGRASPRVLVTMGGLESTPLKFPPSWGLNSNMASFVHRARMVENADELVKRLKAVHGGPGYEVADYVVFDKLSHAISPWTALAWGVFFAFPSPY